MWGMIAKITLLPEGERSRHATLSQLRCGQRHLELVESDDNLTVRAEVPGFNVKELEINVEPRRLTIAGKHQTQEEIKKGKTIYS